jgi:hypothetical protein
MVSPGAAWDDKTTAFFAERERFDVFITSVTKCCGFGTYENEPIAPVEYEINGIMTQPKYVHVEVKVQKEPAANFGGWIYNTRHDRGWFDNQWAKVDIPLLSIWVFDPEFAIGEAIFESHRAAILCGNRKSQVRFWKRLGDGLMTARDIERGYSSRYPLLGLYVWSVYESQKLPRWAVPYGTENFSIEDLPPTYDLKL